jgi:8-oxo-dGTP pyrophosphatase MutT (NUDIX family)
MTVKAEHIRATLTAYQDAHSEETPDLAVIWNLLASEADLQSRKEFRGHATANAILANPAGQILFIHHLALDRWLTPGGHLEPHDTTLIDAALRELSEETGIRSKLVEPVSEFPIHIDIHPIPANPAKDEPQHRHIDFRFLFTTSADVAELQAEEVTDAAWRSIETITDQRLRTRVAEALADANGQQPL